MCLSKIQELHSKFKEVKQELKNTLNTGPPAKESVQQYVQTEKEMESKNVQTPDVEENFEDYKQIAQNQHSSYVYFKE